MRTELETSTVRTQQPAGKQRKNKQGMRARSRTPPRDPSSSSSQPLALPCEGPSLFEIAVEYLVHHAPSFEKQGTLKTLPARLGESILQHALNERKVNNHTFRALMHMGIGTLTSLDFSSSNALRSKSLQALSKIPDGQFYSFTSLSFANCISLSDSVFSRVISQCHSLESLDLRRCIALKSDTLAMIPIHCPQLRSLNVNHIKNFNEACFVALGRHARHLEALSAKHVRDDNSLYGQPELSFEAFREFIQGVSPTIRILKLTAVFNYDSYDIDFLLRHTALPNLEVMKIDCSNDDLLPSIIASMPKLQQWGNIFSSVLNTLKQKNAGKSITNAWLCGGGEVTDLSPSTVEYFTNIRFITSCCLQLPHARSILHLFGPQLQSLILRMDDPDDEHDSLVSSFAELELPSLQHFELQIGQEPHKLTPHRYMLRACPNLKSYEAHDAHQAYITDIIEMLPKLEKLNIQDFRPIPAPPPAAAAAAAPAAPQPEGEQQQEAQPQYHHPSEEPDLSHLSLEEQEETRILANAELLIQQQRVTANSRRQEVVEVVAEETAPLPGVVAAPQQANNNDAEAAGIKQMITIRAPNLKKLFIPNSKSALGFRFESCLSLSKLTIRCPQWCEDALDVENTILSIASGARQVEILTLDLKIHSNLTHEIGKAMATLVKSLPRLRCLNADLRSDEEKEIKKKRIQKAEDEMCEALGPLCLQFDHMIGKVNAVGAGGGGAARGGAAAREGRTTGRGAVTPAREELLEASAHLMAEAVAVHQSSRLMTLKTSSNVLSSLALLLQREPGNGGPSFPSTASLPLRSPTWRRIHSFETLVSLKAHEINLKEVWITFKEFPCLVDLELYDLFNVERFHIDCTSLQRIHVQNLGIKCTDFFVSERCTSLHRLHLVDCWSIASVNNWLKSLSEAQCAVRQLHVDFKMKSMKSYKRGVEEYDSVPVNNKQLRIERFGKLEQIEVACLNMMHDSLVIASCPQLKRISAPNMLNRFSLTNVPLLEEIQTLETTNARDLTLSSTILEAIASVPTAAAAASSSLESPVEASLFSSDPSPILSIFSASDVPKKGKEPVSLSSGRHSPILPPVFPVGHQLKRLFLLNSVSSVTFIHLMRSCPNLESCYFHFAVQFDNKKIESEFDEERLTDAAEAIKTVLADHRESNPRLQMVKIRQDCTRLHARFAAKLPFRIGEFVRATIPRNAFHPFLFMLPPTADKAEELYARAAEQDTERENPVVVVQAPQAAPQAAEEEE